MLKRRSDSYLLEIHSEIFMNEMMLQNNIGVVDEFVDGAGLAMYLRF